VNLVDHPVAYSQPFNLKNPPINKGAMDSSPFFGDTL
jgi:hypothetical protein